MIATFHPCKPEGAITAPPSKSMAHRYLIGAALSKEICTLSGIDYSEDILATIDCLQALGADIQIKEDVVTIDPRNFMKVQHPALYCRESGSTLRFFLPLALCLGQSVTMYGSASLLKRPLDIYEELCLEKGFILHKDADSITVCGNLNSGSYRLRGNVSSQFITGLIFALVYLYEDSSIEIVPPFESRPYVHLTLSALNAFGVNIAFTDEYRIELKRSKLQSYSGRIEGDYSNAAFLDAFNQLGGSIAITGLSPDSLQGDRIYSNYFRQISSGSPTLDISDCPDLGPILIALAALKNGAVFTGTDRLKAKESDRGTAMHEELKKLGGGLILGSNSITVPKQTLQYKNDILKSHNDHRIAMALSVILSQTGGTLAGAEAVCKSYPGFFNDIKQLGVKVELT